MATVFDEELDTGLHIHSEGRKQFARETVVTVTVPDGPFTKVAATGTSQ
jgi:hypothetical protein